MLLLDVRDDDLADWRIEVDLSVAMEDLVKLEEPCLEVVRLDDVVADPKKPILLGFIRIGPREKSVSSLVGREVSMGIRSLLDDLEDLFWRRLVR